MYSTSTPIRKALWIGMASSLVLIGAACSAFQDSKFVAGEPQLAHTQGEELVATISVDASNIVRTIPRMLYGTNIEWRWNWLEKDRQPDPKLIKLTNDLGVTLMRYPGGLFSDYYHWRNGIGPLDRRPEVLHEPGRDDKSRPYFGTEETLNFARDVGAELWITANAGTGTAQEAADWVKYVNQPTQRVRFWEVFDRLSRPVHPHLDDETLVFSTHQNSVALAGDPSSMCDALTVGRQYQLTFFVQRAEISCPIPAAPSTTIDIHKAGVAGEE